MARLVFPPPIFKAPTPAAYFQIQPLPLQPPTSLRHSRRTLRRTSVVTRAGPSSSTYVFAFVFPLSLLAVTIFASMKVGDKLDRDFLEELAINEAIREAYEEESDSEGEVLDGSLVELQEEEEQRPALQPSRTRNRPKREV